MRLFDLIPLKQITSDLKGESKFDVIEELLDFLIQNNKVNDRELALHDILAREGYLSTGLENGLAIPHAKTDGVSELVIAFGLQKNGIDFQSLDSKPAHLIFLVLSPRDTSGPHIKALAAISRNLKDRNMREAILKSKSAEEIAKLFDTFK